MPTLERAAETTIWKPDWPAARRALEAWWNGTGLALSVTAPKDEPWEEIAPASPPGDYVAWRLDPAYRGQAERYRMSRTYFGGVAFPMFDTDVGGPGSLGLFLGAEGHIAETTVWYEPCIRDPDSHPSLRLDREGRWWKLHVECIEEARQQAAGRYVVGMPDLIENIDTLAQLRGSEQTLMDLLERPEWVKERISEINQAYFECYDALLSELGDAWGGSGFFAFGLWGPGKTAKVQCDFGCMISPAMFRRFVLPALAEQCAWLDYAMFHLDGTQAIPQLENLLSIERLRAIEWTPQAGLPGGGSPKWYDLYRRIKAAGKSVQAVGVEPHEVEPLIDAVGAEGMFIVTSAGSEREARELLRRVGWDEG